MILRSLGSLLMELGRGGPERTQPAQARDRKHINRMFPEAVSDHYGAEVGVE